jgi:Fic-DOC domain mobile mystery protein B
METIDYPDGATPLEPDEMESLKHKHVTKRGELDHLEQANIQSGIQWLASQKKIDVLDELFMKELHKRLFGEVWTWAGTYRKTEKSIGVDPLQISVQLRTLIDDVKYWIENNTYEPTEIAIRFHHRLVKIHLFPNGNGRHARIMADALLIKQLDTKPIDWAKGNDLQSMNERRSEYIHALRKADQNDYELLLKFIDL